MKILMVCEYFPPHYGGVEVVFKNLAEGFVKAGHQVDLVTLHLEGTKAFEVVNGVRIHRVWGAQSRYLFAVTSIFKVWDLARRADIIQTTTFTGAPPAWLAGLLCGKKVVLTVHEVWRGKWNVVTSMGKISNKVHSLLERTLYMLPFDQYVCVSDATMHDLLRTRIPLSKVEKIYNGFDYDSWKSSAFSSKKIREELGISKDTFLYLGWGRPGPSKGFEYALRAVPEISHKIPGSTFLLMLGSRESYPKETARLLSIVRELNIQDNVKIIPSVGYSKLGNYIKAADCVVVPSLCEGFGYTTVEACALGVPVVASYVGSIPEVISGKHVLVRVRDPLAIACGVELVYRKKFVTSSSKKFLWKDAVDGYLRVYEKLRGK